MLEKIGLPAKPSQRGNNWVVDASHCQGCSSQFTFINRKHHCRRCGGLFCNSCSQHRMVLRGQGDSPVRICEPCKQLEEAARFEMRHGHRSRAGRGGLRLTSTDEDEILSQILGEDGKQSFSSTQKSGFGVVSVIRKPPSKASCSNLQEVASQDGGEILRSLSVDEPKHVIGELESSSPDELRQQAIEEKKKYKMLKVEGKAAEALNAFKRGKELERQAGALELLIRKNRRKANKNLEAQKTKDVPNESGRKDNKLSPQLSKEKDDVFAELKELGWSDADIHGGDKKSASVSLEGELSTLIGEFSQKKNADKGAHGIDKTEVLALKKKALVFKREGKLTEAKEELKRAKVLEKQLEEQELFVEDEDSDDEISSLIRSMDADKQNDLAEPSFDFNHLVGVSDDFDMENFDVTDEDMNDPEIAAALSSFGWDEDNNQPEEVMPQLAGTYMEGVISEMQSLKREAVNQKRAGNAAEAMQLLKKAKVLERDLENLENIERPSSDKVKDPNPKLGVKSKLTIQKELLGLKKKALALRREGRLDEAGEELKKGKVLEQQLEEMDKTANIKVIPANNSNNAHLDISSSMSASNDGEEEDVTDQDMHDPTYLSLLKNLGWNDDNETQSFPSNVPTQSVTSSATQAPSSTRTRRRSKAEIQRELLGLKRKALALRRQGETEEAEEILKMAKLLETEMEEIEEPRKDVMVEHQKDDETSTSFVKSAGYEGDARASTEKAAKQQNSGQNSGEVESREERSTHRDNQSSLQEEILVHKRKAVALKREGKLADAREELRQAKLMEKSLEDGNPQPSTSSSDTPIFTPSDTLIIASSDTTISGKKERISPTAAPRPLSSRERFKLQQESLGHKRQALKLRREGRTEEAESEFELAKALEAQLEETTAQDTMKPSGKPVDDLGIEEFLDPQLLSSLKALGLDNADVVSQGPTRPEPVELERAKLEERVKEEKVKAVNLKRAGKQAEALASLRQAKLLEKKLNSIAS